MNRLTKRNEQGTGYYYPECYEKCGGLGTSAKCDTCKVSENACDKLGKYEDADEQRLLLRLPCKVGDTVYHIWNVDDKLEIQKITIATLTNVVAHLENGNFGKYIFLTREEAEQALKKMEREG